MKFKGKCAFVIAPYTLSDPTTRNTIYSISNLYERIIVIQQNSLAKYHSLNLDNVIVVNVKDFINLPRFYGTKNILAWLYYKFTVKKLIRKYRPALFITFQFSPLAAIKLQSGQKLVACVYDIPDPDLSGKLDTIINRQGFKQLKNASLVWTSDEHKSRLTAQFGQLGTLPLICYNCPRLNYIDDKGTGDKLWLRNELRKAGAAISNDSGTVMIRAGAIGPYGGIEETLEAMKSLPPDNLFLMMGRPGKLYSDSLKTLIREYKLEKRAFFWDRPDDQTWKKALFGADIGHLVHLRPPDLTPEAGMYQYNSSLSNYRLFYYMAVGLPIFSYNDPRMSNMHGEANCFIVLRVEQLVQDIIHNWRMLSENRVLRESMAENGTNLFLTKYNWETQFKEIKKFIEDL